MQLTRGRVFLTTIFLPMALFPLVAPYLPEEDSRSALKGSHVIPHNAPTISRIRALSRDSCLGLSLWEYQE